MLMTSTGHLPDFDHAIFLSVAMNIIIIIIIFKPFTHTPRGTEASSNEKSNAGAGRACKSVTTAAESLFLWAIVATRWRKRLQLRRGPAGL